MDAKASDDELQDRIRDMLGEMLNARDSEIEALRARVRDLEQIISEQAPRTVATANTTSTALPGHEVHERRIDEQLEIFREEIVGMVENSGEGLDIFGFTDVTARSENTDNSTFDLNVVEVDLEYHHSDNFGAGAALVWDGGDTAEIGPTFADFHFQDHSIPVRGRIFSQQGFHLQAGRFDIPFGVDYLYFASPDRPNPSAPMTTDRVQAGGFGGDGIRTYGTWKHLDYTAYWVDSVYEDDGSSWGGRLGLSFGRNMYRLHHEASPRVLEFGSSVLFDFDAAKEIRNRVFGIDLTFNYGIFQLIAEAMMRDAHDHTFDGNGVDLGEHDEHAWYLSSIVNLEDFANQPLTLYARYGRWHPDFDFVTDDEDDTVTYRVESIPRFTLGLSYNFSDFLQLKLEYHDTFGNTTAEPGFENSMATAQMVISF